MTTESISDRFRAVRERAGLTIAEVARLTGLSEPSIWDLESFDDELTSVCSSGQLQRFGEILGVRPAELLGIARAADPVSGAELASAIREHCRVRGMAIDAFGDAAGWDVSQAVSAPERFLSDFSIDGIRHICREVGIDWRRFISGLTAAEASS